MGFDLAANGRPGLRWAKDSKHPQPLPALIWLQQKHSASTVHSATVHFILVLACDMFFELLARVNYYFHLNITYAVKGGLDLSPLLCEAN
jgi:hypothetical protein